VLKEKLDMSNIKIEGIRNEGDGGYARILSYIVLDKFGCYTSVSQDLITLEFCFVERQVAM